MKLAALITCHNRRETTLRCLRALFECRLPDDVQLQVLLVDDGSTDGTGEAVRGAYPQVEVLPGDGSLYWTGGMRKAFAVAMGRRFDNYLWLNDDTCLYQEALVTLLEVAAEVHATGHNAAIVVGSTHSRGGGPANYGGIRRKRRHLNRELVEPQSTAIPCETMHGNCVLVPHEIAQRIGNLDPAFIHTIGDIDYGLRASQAGFMILVMPGYAGICELNPLSETPFDPSLPLNIRYERLFGPKGLPLKPWFIFLWRHFGFVGLAHWLWTYVKVPLTWLRARMRLR